MFVRQIVVAIGEGHALVGPGLAPGVTAET